MYEIYGASKGENDSVSIWENALHPQDTQKALQAIDDALNGVREYRLEFRIVRPGGEIRYIQGDGTVIRDDDGRSLRMVGTNIDITEQKKLEEELRQSQKMEAMGQLAGGISHDFNNQLASVMGFAEVLGAGLGDSPLKKYVEKIISAVETSSSLTKQLLTFSRKNHLSIEIIDMHQLIRDALELDAEKCSVQCDKSLLQNAIFNLCLNARDAMPEGGKLTIKTECVAQPEDAGIATQARNLKDSYIRIKVMDTGIGIAEEEKEKIIEPFYTT